MAGVLVLVTEEGESTIELVKAAGGTLSVTPQPAGAAGVTAVTATAPIASSGGATPNITHNASAVTPGSYTSANITVDADGHVTAAASGAGGGVTAVTATAPLTSSGGATPAISASSFTGSGVPFVSAGTEQVAAVSGPDVIVSATTLLVEQITGNAGSIPILASASVLGSGGTAPVNAGTFAVANPGALGTLFATIAIPASSVVNFSFTAQITDGAGNTSVAEYDFYYQRNGAGAPALVGASSTTAVVAYASGVTTSWGVVVAVSGNNITLTAVGPVAGLAKIALQDT